MSQLNDLQERITRCRLCPRLVAWREEVARVKRRAYRDWDYWGRPVAGFGDPHARILVIGLAPGAHGSNRTGRVFTGDDSGVFLFRALHRAGFANQPTSTHIGDGLTLNDVYITAVCRCAPPDNKPTRTELLTCQPYFQEEIRLFPRLQGYVVLGKIALDGLLSVMRAADQPVPPLEFGHARLHTLGSELPWLITSYHPSRQNTQTGRLTQDMFDQVWRMARDQLR